MTNDYFSCLNIFLTGDAANRIFAVKTNKARLDVKSDEAVKGLLFRDTTRETTTRLML